MSCSLSLIILNVKQGSCEHLSLTQPGIKPKHTVSVPDALSTRPLKISRASFCCIKKLKKLHLFLMKVAKSCIYSQTLKTAEIYSSDLFTYNAKYLQRLLREKWRSFAKSLLSMLKLHSTVHEVVSQLLRHK